MYNVAIVHNLRIYYALIEGYNNPNDVEPLSTIHISLKCPVSTEDNEPINSIFTKFEPLKRAPALRST